MIPIITGATCSGKSHILYNFLKNKNNFEIISADAFQVYKYLDIGTAKPNREIRAEFSHHLIDIITPDNSFNAGDFVKRSEDIIADILKRGKLPIVVGGTGLYIKSLTEGIFEAPDILESTKKGLKDENPKELFSKLSEVDPVYAAKIHPNDAVRIRRALEVFLSSGMPLSKAWESFKRNPQYKYFIMVVARDVKELDQDIDLRVKKMLEAGWVSEVEKLRAMGFLKKSPAFRAIGYKEIYSILEEHKNLTCSVINTLASVISLKTRQFAKRQRTWFRGMHVTKHLKPQEVIETLESWYRDLER